MSAYVDHMQHKNSTRSIKKPCVLNHQHVQLQQHIKVGHLQHIDDSQMPSEASVLTKMLAHCRTELIFSLQNVGCVLLGVNGFQPT